MKNCKVNMTPGYRKCGYLKVGRNVLKAFFGKDCEQRRLAGVLLCVQTFVYFSEGTIRLNNISYICRPGEWVTSLTELASLTGLCRKSVKRCLERLESDRLLQVKELDGYKLIVLSDLRNSGAIEQIADVVVFVYRAEKYNIYYDSKTKEDLRGVGLLLVAKNRNGATGVAKFRYNPAMTCLTDYDPRVI